MGAPSTNEFFNGTISGAGATQIVIANGEARSGVSLTLTTDAGSTLAATLTLEMSDNYDFRRPSVARWATVTDATIVAFLGAAFGTGMKPNGAAGSGKLQINPLTTCALRFTITWVSGSGVTHLDASFSQGNR